jgi:hypothetical protein
MLRLIGSREAEGLRTVITSQLEPEQLFATEDPDQLSMAGHPTARAPRDSAHIPPPLVSRMLSGLRVYFPGEDARLRVTP